MLSVEEAQTEIVIDAAVDVITDPTVRIARICWNTGEEKNCSGCYLSTGCKAKE
jgi:hypothetical protein